jgi:hypothetical protein
MPFQWGEISLNRDSRFEPLNRNKASRVVRSQTPPQSARGLAQSKTSRTGARTTWLSRGASWTSVVLYRFLRRARWVWRCSVCFSPQRRRDRNKFLGSGSVPTRKRPEVRVSFSEMARDFRRVGKTPHWIRRLSPFLASPSTSSLALTSTRARDGQPVTRPFRGSTLPS